jgi:hypothetical protein
VPRARLAVWRRPDDAVRAGRAGAAAGPIVRDETITANTNEEAVVVAIERDEHLWHVYKCRHLKRWLGGRSTGATAGGADNEGFVTKQSR